MSFLWELLLKLLQTSELLFLLVYESRFSTENSRDYRNTRFLFKGYHETQKNV